MKRVRIGNRDSAIHRVDAFLEMVEAWNGRRPAVVALFEEDFRALDRRDLNRYAARGLRVVPGPSIKEYAPIESEPTRVLPAGAPPDDSEPLRRVIHLLRVSSARTACGISELELAKSGCGPGSTTVHRSATTCRRCLWESRDNRAALGMRR